MPQTDETAIPLVAKLVIAFTSSNLLALALWYNSILSPLAFILFGKSNVIVGALSCAYGMCQLFAAFISGCVTDSDPTRRPAVLQVGAVIGAVGLALMCWAVVTDWSSAERTSDERIHTTLPLYIAGCSTVGVFAGVASANVEALMASVIAKGKRDGVYAKKFIFEALSGLGGIVATLVLFGACGNDWSENCLSIGMLIGLGLHCFVLVLLVVVARTAAQWQLEGRLFHGHTTEGEERPQETNAREEDQQQQGAPSSWFCTPVAFSVSRRALPWFVTAQDILVSIGSGMTMRYFVLFLLSPPYNAKPITVILAIFACIVLQAVFVKLNQRLTTPIPFLNNNNNSNKQVPAIITRVQALWLSRFFGPLCLLYLGVVTTGPAAALGPTLLFYIVRHAFMNSTVAISRSLIMDTCHPSSRAKWNAAESLLGASWAGSSLAGGFLADRYGYRSTFLITCAFHGVALLILTSIIRTADIRSDDVVANEVAENEEQEQERGRRASADAADDGAPVSSSYFLPAAAASDDVNVNRESVPLLK